MLSEIPSSTCAKLRTVAAGNNRDHASQSLIIACSLHAYIFLFFAHIPFVVNHTINATPPERLQQFFCFSVGCCFLAFIGVFSGLFASIDIHIRIHYHFLAFPEFWLVASGPVKSPLAQTSSYATSCITHQISTLMLFSILKSRCKNFALLRTLVLYGGEI